MPGGRTAACLLATVSAAGCSNGGTGLGALCSTPLSEFFDGGFERSSIPALDNPRFSPLFAPDIIYAGGFEHVIGIRFNGQWLAIPHKLLWHHEVVNLEVPGEHLTVTYSPLTGSSLVFDRLPAAVGAFDVSQYVLETNLVLEDASGTLWPQMASVAGCGPMDGVELTRVPHQEMTLGAWVTIHDDTRVASSATGFDFLYNLYPYGNYDQPSNTSLRFPLSGAVDTRLPPKGPVLGVQMGDESMAFSIADLDALRGQVNVAVSVANAVVGGEPIAVFYNAVAQGALAYRAQANGQRLTFSVSDGMRVDDQTGTVWDFQGEAFEGPLTGERLEPITDAYVAFWFAWAAFHPDAAVWTTSTPFSIAPWTEPLGLPEGPIDWELSRR
jgi:hypothetical protein